MRDAVQNEDNEAPPSSHLRASLASVERKSLADLVTSLTSGKLRYQVAALAALPRAAVVVEDRYSQLFKLDRVVALKFLPSQALGTEEEKARFVREAQAAALNHPNVCTIYDIQEHEGEQFIVMEYVDGVTLREKLRVERNEQEGDETSNNITHAVNGRVAGQFFQLLFHVREDRKNSVMALFAMTRRRQAAGGKLTATGVRAVQGIFHPYGGF